MGDYLRCWCGFAESGAYIVFCRQCEHTICWRCWLNEEKTTGFFGSSTTGNYYCEKHPDVQWTKEQLSSMQ